MPVSFESDIPLEMRTGTIGASNKMAYVDYLAKNSFGWDNLTDERLEVQVMPIRLGTVRRKVVYEAAGIK